MRAVLFGLVGAVLAVGSAGADPLAGVYRGSGRDSHSGIAWDLYAKIEPAGHGKYNINVVAGNASCASSMDGVGVLSGKTLKVFGDCDLSVGVSGKSLSVTEGGSCARARSPSCEYAGSLKKTE